MDILQFLYHTKPGRLLLAPLTAKPVSLLAGALLDTPLSRPLIRPFAKAGAIRCEDYLVDNVRSFNDFFCRKIRANLRPIDQAPDALIAPCDGLLSVHRITNNLVLPVKQSRFSISSLMGNAPEAARFNGGYCFVFRLCVGHYHRYVYPLSGAQEATVRLEGKYHTVRPVALADVPVFCENTREYTLLHDGAAAVLQVEVGALLVGRIRNHRKLPGPVTRGQEKGYFEYGGSTIILLTEPGYCEPFAEYAQANGEVPVSLGSAIARKSAGARNAHDGCDAHDDQGAQACQS